jgi:hypothetical protein
MLCALTVRKLKPGTFEDFKAALRGGPIWPDPDTPRPHERDQASTPWKRFYALRNAEDENEVITCGFFDGSLEELRARQSRSGGYGQRSSAVEQFVEAKVVDGVYEVLAERSLG